MTDLPFEWIISDSHWQHRNINKYCWRTTPAYPTPEAVDQLMYDNWHALVKPEDRILHLGDLCKWDQGEPIPEIEDLPGKKFLLRGNHDNYPDEWYADHGFEIVTEADTTLLFTHELGEAIVRMTHYPIASLPPKTVNVHGHVHRNPCYSTPSHINVCVELTHFAPVRLERVLESVMWHHTRESSGKRSR